MNTRKKLEHNDPAFLNESDNVTERWLKVCNSCVVKKYVLKSLRKEFVNKSIFSPIQDERGIGLKVIGEYSHDTDDKSGRDYACKTADQPRAY